MTRRIRVTPATAVDIADAYPERMRGQPCMRGTRIPVHVILDNLAIGIDETKILTEYPTLSQDHIRAALAFTADLAHDRILPVPA